MNVSPSPITAWLAAPEFQPNQIFAPLHLFHNSEAGAEPADTQRLAINSFSGTALAITFTTGNTLPRHGWLKS